MNAAPHISSLRGGWWENKHNASNLEDGVIYEGIMNRLIHDDEKQKEKLTDNSEQE